MTVQSCLVRRLAAQRRSHTYLQTRLRCAQQRRGLSSTSSLRNEGGLPNHYATLDITPHASSAEIKKQFYKLSKSHHPDLHPNDTAAPQRFVEISEAYATLGSPEKRARYDRDFHRSHNSTPTPRGSFSSHSTPFGGRPASGLSRRRTQFRGPPPSFYSSGGWGQQTDKRSDAASQASHTYEAQGRAQSNAEPGVGPSGTTQGYDVPHFNSEAHARTHGRIQQRRDTAKKQQAQRIYEAERDNSASTLFDFLWVGGLFLGIFWAGGMLARRRNGLTMVDENAQPAKGS